MTKSDYKMVLFFMVLAIGMGSVFWLMPKNQGGSAKISIDGVTYGVYDLEVDQTIVIGESNVLVIKDGMVDMTEADCRDQICVNHAPISQDGEMIICLPNKMIVEIEEMPKGKLNESIKYETGNEIDAIVN